MVDVRKIQLKYARKGENEQLHYYEWWTQTNISMGLP